MCTPVLPALWRRRQKEQDFKPGLAAHACAVAVYRWRSESGTKWSGASPSTVWVPGSNSGDRPWQQVLLPTPLSHPPYPISWTLRVQAQRSKHCGCHSTAFIGWCYRERGRGNQGRISHAPFLHGASVWAGHHGHAVVAGEPRPEASQARDPWSPASMADGLLPEPPSAVAVIGGAP